MKAYLTLIKLLSRRDYSEHKIREKLRTRGFLHEDIEAAIKTAKEKNYLREELYASARVKAFMNKGYSEDYIKRKLEQEEMNVADDFISDIYAENNRTEADQIRELIRKKAKNAAINDFDAEVKIIRFLLSKGHDLGMIKKELKEYKNSSILSCV